MASVVSICNLALSNVGKANITALNEQSAEARACNQFYEHARNTLLAAFDWSFARKIAAMGAVANDKAGEWKAAYSLPNDRLKVRWIRPQYDEAAKRIRPEHYQRAELAIPFELQGETLYSDLTPCFLRYTFRLTDPTKFSDLFIDALSWHLASYLAMPLTRDPKIRSDAQAVAQQAQGVAAEADAGQQQHDSGFVSSFLEARNDDYGDVLGGSLHG